MFEKVNPCHPDKLADRIAGALVDLAYAKSENPKIAVEVLIGHGVCHIISETSTALDAAEVKAAVKRIAGRLKVDYKEVAQDIHLAVNQADKFRCGDNGIFKGVPVTEEQMKALVEAMDGQAGDLLLFAADKDKLVWNVLGALRLELAEQMDLIDKNEYRFVWITEFPLLEWSEEENRFTAMHHPFTMPMDEDIPLLDTDPGAVRAKAYDIVLNGSEIGGGSVRIHQNDIQEKMIEMLGFTKEQANSQFGFLLEAFKYGVPPHAGLAYGLDRLVMEMAKIDNIRDVIAFPKVKDASCLMTEAPSPVDPAQLEELGLEIERESSSEE